MNRRPFSPAEIRQILWASLWLILATILTISILPWGVRPFFGAFAAYGWSRLGASRLAPFCLLIIGLAEDSVAGHGFGLMASTYLLTHLICLHWLKPASDDFFSACIGGALAIGITAGLLAIIQLLFTGEWLALRPALLDVALSIVIMPLFATFVFLGLRGQRQTAG